MTVTTRPRQRQRSLPTPDADSSLNTNSDVTYDDALRTLLERLETIRSEAVAMRDEHTHKAVEIEEHITTRDIANKAVSKVKSIRTGTEPIDYSAALLANQAPTTFVPTPPSLPAVKLLSEQEPSEKLIREQSIIIRAQAITRKNAELARERLPKQPEAQRNKTWLDYFVDEAVWMATDFREERKWKILVAKKLAKGVMQYHAQRAARDARAKLEEHQRVVKAANSVARDVRKFWSQIREIAEFRLSRSEKARMFEESQEKLSKFLEKTQAYSDQLASRFQKCSQLPDTLVSDGVKRPKISDTVSTGTQIFHPAPSDHPKGAILQQQPPMTRSEASEVKVRFSSSDKSAPRTSVLQRSAQNELEVQGPSCSHVVLSSLSSKSRNVPSQIATVGFDVKPPPSLDESIFDGTARPNAIQVFFEKCPSENLVKEATPIWPDFSSNESVPEPDQKPNSTKQGQLASESCLLSRVAQIPVNGHDEMELVDRSERQQTLDQAKEASGADERCNTNGHKLTLASIRVPNMLLRGELRDYQFSGMQWLVNLYKNASNGILADEMGLGKTIQTIALLAWLAIEKGIWGPHLIVVPTSVILNWEVEFKKWLPSFKILTYFGSIKERRDKRRGWTDPELFHVCITSYTLAVQDNHILRRKKWVYLILDEAHNIKNFKSQRWQTLLNFSARRRLLLTGTPLQNSVMELWSLLHFLMPSLFESHSEFKDWFSNPLQDADDPTAEDVTKRSRVVEKLHSVLRPFLLRRLKADVEKGLPPKHEHIIKCHLGKRQRQLYEDFMARSDVRENLNSGDVFKVMNVLMQLRKVCNHPDLFEGRPILSPFAMRSIFYPVPSCVIDLCRKHPLDELNLDLLSLDFCSKEQSWPGHWYNKETERLSADHLMRDFCLNQASSGQCGAIENAKLSETTRRTLVRSTKFRREAIYYSAVLSAHRIRARGLLGEDVRTVCLMTPTSLVESLRWNRSPHNEFVSYCTPFLVSTIEDLSEKWGKACEQFVFCVTKVSSASVEMRYQGDDAEHAVYSDLFLDLSFISSPLRTLFRQFDIRRQVTIPDKRLIQWDCGKLQILDVLLRKLMTQNSRALIFTQMSKVLDVLESFLNLHTYRYVRLDGATRTDDRQKLVQRFNTDKRIFCMILTTRAGGVGLNLTGADSVVFYDTDYNPAIDNQAQDRAHRIGQTKPVHIYRLICEQTVEENILQRANKKRSLENQIISDAGFTIDALHGPENVDRVIQSDTSALVRPRKHVANSSREDRSIVLNNVSNTVSSSSGGSMRGGENVRNLDLKSVSGAHGKFEGFRTAKLVEREEGISDNFSGSNVVNTSASNDYEQLINEVMSWDEDHEERSNSVVENERRLLDAEFEDEVAITAPTRVKRNFADDEFDLEGALTPVQKYALRIIETWYDYEDDRGNRDSASFEVSSCAQKLGQENKSSSVKEPGYKFEDGPVLHSIRDVRKEEPIDIKEELFYELDVSEEGRLNYLKALTDTDVDLNLYLPLRDGGPEELKVSAVVRGTAAAGLECAEDAAFFPHAYNRMSRTPYATKRQKEKYRVKTAADRRQREGEVQPSSPRHTGPALAINSPPQPIGNVPPTVSGAERNIVGALRGLPKSGDGERDIIAKMNQNASGLAAGGCASTSSATNVCRRDALKGMTGKRKGSNSSGLLKSENQMPDLARTILEFSLKPKPSKESKKPRGYSKVDSTTISNDTHPNTGLFRKAPKKAPKKLTQNAVRSVRGMGGSSFIDGSKLDNTGWTKEEDEELMNLAELYNNNMQLAAAILSNSEKVLIGTRRRRNRDRCSERLLKCLGKGRSSQTGPLAVITDAELMRKHKDELKGAVEKKPPDLASLHSTTAMNDMHPTQAVIVAEAQAKMPGFTTSVSIPTFQVTEKLIAVPKHHRPGWKPTETTPSALQRKKYPYMVSAREDLRLDNNGVPLKTSNYGSGYQVSGCAPGDTIVVSAPPPIAECSRRKIPPIPVSGSTTKNMAVNLVNNVKCPPASGLPGTISSGLENALDAVHQGVFQPKSFVKTPVTKSANTHNQNFPVPPSRRDQTTLASSGFTNDLKSQANGTQPAKIGLSNSKVANVTGSGKKVLKRPLVTENANCENVAEATRLKKEGQSAVCIPGTCAKELVCSDVEKRNADSLSGIRKPAGVVKPSGRGKPLGAVRKTIGNASSRGMMTKNRTGVTSVGKVPVVHRGFEVGGSSNQDIGRGGSNQSVVRNGVVSSSVNMVEKSSVISATMGLESLSSEKVAIVGGGGGSNRTEPQATDAKISPDNVNSVAKNNDKVIDRMGIVANGISSNVEVEKNSGRFDPTAEIVNNKVTGNSAVDNARNEPIEPNCRNGIVKQNNGDMGGRPKSEVERIDGKEMPVQGSSKEKTEPNTR